MTQNVNDIIILLCTIMILLFLYIFWNNSNISIVQQQAHKLHVNNMYTKDKELKYENGFTDSTKLHRNYMFTRDEELKYENGFTDSTDVHYLDYIRSRWINKPSNFSRNLKNKQKQHYSQFGQSEFVDSLLQGKRNGFFIECGAANGENLSNTLFFEVQRNWTGLLVEANLDFYSNICSLNRKVYTSNVCLNIKNSSEKQIFSSHREVGGISDYLNDIYHAPLSKSNRKSTQCFPLDALLNAIGINHVDYFSLDVEGAELDILKTIPYHKIRIDVIGIEYKCLTGGMGTDAEPTRQKLQHIRQYFKSLKIYKEVGICPNNTLNQQTLDQNGIDVFFQRI